MRVVQILPIYECCSALSVMCESILYKLISDIKMEVFNVYKTNITL